MSDPDSEPQPPRLEYRSVEDDRKPGEAWKVLAFMAGMLVGLFICAFGGGICAAITLNAGPKGPLPVIAIPIGLVFLGLGVWAAISSVRLKRKRLANMAFLIGLLCGACAACLLEGFCFTAVGLSQ